METVGDTSLHWGDIAVILIYFVFVLAVGLWSSRQNRGSAGGYFLAGRSMNWIPSYLAKKAAYPTCDHGSFVGSSSTNMLKDYQIRKTFWIVPFYDTDYDGCVGASLFASNIGSLHFVGMVGSGAASGIAIALYELNAMYVLMILCYIFLPVYMASGVFTMPEYLKLRFGGNRIQICPAILALLVYIFTKIAADLYAGAIFIEQSLKWNTYIAIIALLAVAALFTVAGGLTAVIWTDFIQTIVMIVGAFVIMVLAFMKVGGISGLIEKYPDAMSNFTRYGNTSLGRPREDFMHLFRDPVTSDLPWPGLVGITINSIWYWCSDQVIVQRALAGKTYDHSKAGTILCAYIKILPLFLLVLPGMIARILYTETVGCGDPDICEEICGVRSGCSNIAYPSLVIGLLPAGARGLMLAVMLSALMSSLTSIFNSSATIFAMDIWTHIRSQASELELMTVGRVFVVVLVAISVVWVPVLQVTGGADLYRYTQEVSSFLQPPICCIFLMGIFWSRLNEKGAFFGLLVGMIMGVVRFILQYSFHTPPGELDRTPGFVKDFHYLYYSVFLFVVTAIVAAIVSLLTAPIDHRCIRRLTFWTRHNKQPRFDIDKAMPPATAQDRPTELKNVILNGDDPRPDDKFLTPSDVDVDDVAMVIKPDRQLPWYRRIANFICGLDNVDKTHIDRKQITKQDMLSITEDRRWKITSNIAAVVAMVICIAIGVIFR